MRKLSAGVLAGLMAALLLSACSSPTTSSQSTSSGSPASKPLKVAFVLGGAPSDGGFYLAVYQGIQQAITTFGSKIDVTYKLNVPESPQSSQVIDSLAQGGDQLIFGTSFGYHQYMATAAKQYPNAKFDQFESTEFLSNMGEWNIGIEQAWYLAGMAAGAATKTNKIGVVASLPIPGLIKQVNAMELGAKSVNPNATARVVWMNSFYNPPAETQAAQSLASSGHDVLVTMMDSPAVGQAAEKAGLPYIGHDLDQQKFAPNSWMTGASFIFGPYFVREIGALLGGKWTPENYYGLLKDGLTGLAPFGPRYQQAVPTQVQDQIQQRQKDLEAGTLQVFTGPILDQSGKTQIPAGQSATLAQINQMSYLVQGVEGTAGGG